MVKTAKYSAVTLLALSVIAAIGLATLGAVGYFAPGALPQWITQHIGTVSQTGYLAMMVAGSGWCAVVTIAKLIAVIKSRCRGTPIDPENPHIEEKVTDELILAFMREVEASTTNSASKKTDEALLAFYQEPNALRAYRNPNYNMNMLHLAVAKEDHAIISDLLSKVPELALGEDNLKRTPIMLAKQKNQLHIVQLIENNRNVQNIKQAFSQFVRELGIRSKVPEGDQNESLLALTKDRSFLKTYKEPRYLMNLLHLAVQKNNISVIKILLVQAPDLSAVRDKFGMTPLDLANENGNDQVEQLLQPYPIESKESNSSLIANYLFDYEYIETGFEEPLTYDQLMQKLKDPTFIKNLRNPSMQNMTLLHQAAKDNNRQVLKAILEIAPGLINVQDDQGNTALHVAAGFLDDPVTIQLLLDAGADYNIENKDEKDSCPADVALKFRHMQSAAALIAHANLVPDDGNSSDSD